MAEDETSCHHMHVDFVPFFDVADWGIGYPVFLDGDRDGDLLRIPDPRVDPTADPEAVSLFEYRVGELWPQRYLRSAPQWGFEETLLQLVSAEPGGPLAPIAPWPAPDLPGPAAGVDALFPGADGPLLDLPFTVGDAVAELRRNEVSRAAVDGACVVDLHAWADRPTPDALLPPVSLTSNVGEIQVETLGRDEVLRAWSVWLERDALGREQFHVRAGEGDRGHPSFTCADREVAHTSWADFLAAVPDGIEQGRLGSIRIQWSPDYAGRPPRASYSVQYEPAGGAHWRSSTLHAGTGQWSRFTFLAGDPLDPEQNG